jgi:hypothetical protein
MREKLFDLAIDYSLTAAKRKAINRHLERHSHLSDAPVHCLWDESGGETLRITAHPVTFEVKFQARKVEIYGSAPLWARLLLTEKKKAELKKQIQLILTETGFVAEQERR